jgi:hypothetical protein
MGWVLGNIVTEEMGLSAGQLRGMCQRGTLQRGVHFVVVEHKTFYKLEAIWEWLDGEASRQRTAFSGGVPLPTGRMRLGRMNLKRPEPGTTPRRG